MSKLVLFFQNQKSQLCIVQHRRECYLLTLKDIFYIFMGPELSDGFPGIAHHVIDDLWLEGVTLLTHFQLCLILKGGDRTHKHDSQLNHKVQFLTLYMNYNGSRMTKQQLLWLRSKTKAQMPKTTVP